MKKALIILITVCLLLSLCFFINATDLHMVISLIGKIGMRFFLLLFVTFIAYLLATLSWQFTLAKNYPRVSLKRLFLIRQLGETIGMFNPTSVIGGDALKALLLEEQHIPRKATLWSIILSRGIMILSQLILFIVTLLTLLIQHPEMYTATTRHRQSGWYPLLMAHWRAFHLKSSNALSEFPQMFRENKKMLVISAVFAIMHWVFGGLEFYLILKFLGLEVSFLQALLVDLGVVLFKSAGAFIPAQIGVEEYGNKFMLLFIGISAPQIWITASILRRARQLVWIIFGIAIYFVLFKKSKYLNPAHHGDPIRQS